MSFPPSMPEEHSPHGNVSATPHPLERSRKAAFGRLISLIISIALAWALTVAITAWLLGLVLTRG